jgi:capsular exopolysaccharide synthesis family protein
MDGPKNEVDRPEEQPRGRAGGALVERPQQVPTHWLPQYGPPPAEHDEDDDSIDLRQYWEIVVKRKWTVLTFLGIVVAAVFTATLLQTKIYRASLTMQIEQQGSRVTRIEEVTPIEQSWDGREFYQTQYELLRSRALAQRVVAQINLGEHPLYKEDPAKQAQPGLLASIRAAIGGAESGEQPKEAPGPEDRERGLVSGLLGGLDVVPVRNSRLVNIHFESPDAELAARVVNTLATEFINLNLERRMDASSYAKTFLNDRLQQIRVKLEESEKALNDFMRRETMVRVDEKSVGPESQVLSEFTAALARVQGERIRAEALYRQTESVESTALTAVLENAVIQELKKRKAKLEGDYQEGLKIFKPSYPKMLQLESQIAETQAKIEEEVKAVRGALKANYEAALAQEKMLQARLDESKRTVLSVQDRSFQYNLLKRDVDTYRQLYEGLLQRYREVGVAGGVGVNNITVVDRAEVPKAPFKPNLQRNLMIALAIGLMGGIGLAFFFEHLDDSLKVPQDLEKELGLPVLGVIPLVASRTDEDLAMAENADPRSTLAEAYRSVRTALQFSTDQGMPKLLMVTSTDTGEGKSTTALSLAIQIALAGRTVLLIDGDLRKSSLHRKLGVSNAVGLTNHLAGDAQPVDVTRPCAVPKLFLIPSGPLPPNPAELLGGARMASLLKLAAERFDHVVIDGPPVLGLADAPLLGSLADASLLVVQSGSTSRRQAREAVKRLRATRTRLVGGVLTKMDAHGRAYGYHSQHYYYRYGSEGQAERLTT